jgi:hypothetical protein
VPRISLLGKALPFVLEVPEKECSTVSTPRWRDLENDAKGSRHHYLKR